MSLIHADHRLPAVVHAATLPWDPSPAAGVDRRRIERVGGEVARLTSIVRYAPGSRFDAHTHSGGEEYLVLSGVFSDEGGDHPAGTCVRNGVGSSHAPFTAGGCTILVKLWWMHPDETASSVVDTAASEGWEDSAWGAQRLLHQGLHDRTDLFRLDPGAVVTLSVEGGAEVFVLTGELTAGTELLHRWSWCRAPGDGPLVLAASGGAEVYVKRGHLAHPPALPLG